ncbi:MAG: hypothetical protein E6J90_42725 [Deltaproteobacteria bacterium]|nr:MAG: hypothetical protein E6J90_42725 [Deltaproteobacteria bacterium]TMQ09550.1 MAG: hypothetical protein E6J91_29935 [Deltaproteobacteria bacterium]
MPTTYTVTFDKDGNITSIESTSTEKYIKHARKQDTIKFMKPANASWSTVNIVSTTSGVPHTSLFGSNPVTAGTTANPVSHTINHNGVTTVADFEFTPVTSGAGGPDSDPGRGPPDTGTIKVGG